MFWTPFVGAQEKTTIRFGHFPNITHAQGVIAHALSRQGKGWFENASDRTSRFSGLLTMQDRQPWKRSLPDR